MTSNTFLVFMQHFIKYSYASVDSKVSLLLDNLESHISIPSIELAKANGEVMLSFPPHCNLWLDQYMDLSNDTIIQHVRHGCFQSSPRIYDDY